MTLPGGSNEEDITYTSARGIAVSGDTVYVAGAERDTKEDFEVCYWKNGERVSLSGGYIKGVANGIALGGRKGILGKVKGVLYAY